MSILPIGGSSLAPYSNSMTFTASPHAGISPAAQVAEVKECQTCRNRKYQDRSDDPTVSFQTPTRVSREGAYEAVVAHEHEHVQHEQARAQATGRKVVYQQVSVRMSVCPECGRTYVSGGETVTATTDDPKKDRTGKNRLEGKGQLIDTMV